ncbi:MAG: hypothetical protein QOF45_2818 [Gaiellaceae bacterium]|jgi:hypothetical protein|nr:hypothetical protein [Gaiellaceae bacterium]
MRRPLLLVAVLLLAGCGSAEPESVKPVRAAEPQRAVLDWRESYPSSGQRLVFVVHTLEITKEGWSADIAVTDSTRIPFELGAIPEPLVFGLMLFPTDDLDELADAADTGRLPAPRLATRFEPAPPDLLAPGQTWRTTISAPGSLADGAYVRVSFGPFRAKGDPPPGMQPTVSWITDRSYRL